MWTDTPIDPWSDDLPRSRRYAALGRGETPKEVLMGRVVQFRPKPTKLAGQGRPGSGAANSPADVLTIILAVAAGGLAVLKVGQVLADVVRVLLWIRRPRLEATPVRWRR
jgi:hypothetical protein